MSRSTTIRPGNLSELDQGEAIIRVSLGILSAYLFITAIPLLRWSTTTRSWSPLITHLAVLAVTFLCIRGRRGPFWLRAWAPLALVPLLYVGLRWVIAGAARPHVDSLVAGWDTSLFGTDASRTLALAWPFVGLSELLHVCSYVLGRGPRT